MVFWRGCTHISRLAHSRERLELPHGLRKPTEAVVATKSLVARRYGEVDWEGSRQSSAQKSHVNRNIRVQCDFPGVSHTSGLILRIYVVALSEVSLQCSHRPKRVLRNHSALFVTGCLLVIQGFEWNCVLFRISVCVSSVPVCFCLSSTA